jgi:hypothetical protein
MLGMPIAPAIDPVSTTDAPLGSSGRAFWEGEQRTSDVHGVSLVEMLFGDVAEFHEFVESGVEHQHINTPVLRLDGCIEAVDVGQICGVRLHCHRAMPDLRHRVVEFSLSTTGDDDMGPLSGERLCDAQADPDATAGHNRDVAIQFIAHESYSSISFMPLGWSQNWLRQR